VQGASLEIVPPARILGPAAQGWRIAVDPFGEMDLPLLGRYQALNAALAIRAAGAIHAQAGGVTDDTHADKLRAGLAAVRWPGRLQKLQDSPAVYLDGAVNRESARSVVESLQASWAAPLVSIIAVPADKDYAGVYEILGPQSDALILTETPRNPILSFPARETALAAARMYHAQPEYADDLAAALAKAKARAGTDGTILIVGTQSIVADAILLWGETYEEL
jgi:dihydrofolate synthase/folylpolyglutamate synthase